MKLDALQSAFQDALLTGSGEILRHIPDSPRETKDVLFGVYRNAYVLRLLGLLREDFERVHTYVGDEAFDSIARAYIAANPSHTFNARYYGQTFPEFVAAVPRFASLPIVGAIAKLEGLLNEIFDVSDAAALTMQDLAVFAPEDFAAIRFTPHPSARRMDGPAGLEAIFTALSNGDVPPAASTRDTEHILVWRKNVVPHYRVLSDEEAMMWDEAAKDIPFDILCEMLATYDDAETAGQRAAGYLQGWIDGGLLHAASCGASSAT